MGTFFSLVEFLKYIAVLNVAKNVEYICKVSNTKDKGNLNENERSYITWKTTKKTKKKTKISESQTNEAFYQRSFKSQSDFVSKNFLLFF